MADSKQPIRDTEDFRDHISTVAEDGSRIYVYPKKQKGKRYWYRTIVATLLLISFFVIPFLKVNGHPLMLFNVLKREFIILGVPFTPQDTFLFAVSMIAFLVVIVLFTAVFGRLFCGWLCPQTIFMEHIFRRIEYAIEGDANKSRRLDKGPWTKEKIWKKGLKWTIFFMIALLISHFFLAYIIGIDGVLDLVRSPFGSHIGGFLGMMVFSFAFFIVFANIRDQVCTTICPYGRLQGVLLDKNSIVVSYDFERGEPRGRVKKKKKKTQIESVAASSDVAVAAFEGDKNGDCVDCDLCVKVCPTGIDIRNGTQLECINCTLCMDACDSIMDKVKRPQGLIRYASYNSIVDHKPNQVFTTRSMAYSLVMVALMGFLGYLMFARTSVKPMIQRARGAIYMEIDETHGKNLYNYQLINKTRREIPVTFKLLNKQGQMELIGAQKLLVPPTGVKGGMATGSIFISLEKGQLDGKITDLEIGVFIDGKQIDVLETNFLGPGQ